MFWLNLFEVCFVLFIFANKFNKKSNKDEFSINPKSTFTLY